MSLIPRLTLNDLHRPCFLSCNYPENVHFRRLVCQGNLICGLPCKFFRKNLFSHHPINLHNCGICRHFIRQCYGMSSGSRVWINPHFPAGSPSYIQLRYVQHTNFILHQGKCRIRINLFYVRLTNSDCVAELGGVVVKSVGIVPQQGSFRKSSKNFFQALYRTLPLITVVLK